MIIKKREKEVDIEIIILTFNKIEITKKCLDLLYQNTSIPFGLILIDNGSNDGTQDYLKDFSETKDNITLIFNSVNFGIIKGRNQGYNMSQFLINIPDKIVFLDNDQFVQKEWLKSHLDKLNSGFDIVGVEAWQMRNDFHPLKKIKKEEENFNYIGAGGILIKNEVIKDIGLFDERYGIMFYEDPDFCWRAFDKGYKIGWNPEPIIIHQPHLLLGRNREKILFFRQSWGEHRNKWKGRSLPIMNNNIITK